MLALLLIYPRRSGPSARYTGRREVGAGRRWVRAMRPSASTFFELRVLHHPRGSCSASRERCGTDRAIAVGLQGAGVGDSYVNEVWSVFSPINGADGLKYIYTGQIDLDAFPDVMAFDDRALNLLMTR